jgi:hypothetical protein
MKKPKKYQQISLYGPQSLGKDRKELQIERNYRESFGKTHNQNPVLLAESMYPSPIYLADLSDYFQYQFESQVLLRSKDDRKEVKVEKKEDGSSPAAAKADTKTQAISEQEYRRTIANKFVCQFKETFCLQLCWLRSQTRIKDERLLWNIGAGEQPNKEGEQPNKESEQPNKETGDHTFKATKKRKVVADGTTFADTDDTTLADTGTTNTSDSSERTAELGKKESGETETKEIKTTEKKTEVDRATLAPSLPPFLFHPGGSMPLYCATCLCNDRIELVCVCKFQYSAGKCGLSEMKVSQIFYHDACRAAKCRYEYLKNGYSMLDFPLQNIVGDTYEQATNKINSAPKPKCFIDAAIESDIKLVKKLHQQIWNARGEFPKANNSTDAITEIPPGEPIDVDMKDYDFDNRTYALQPSTSDEYIIESKNHLRTIARIGYYLCTHLCMVKEFAPFSLSHKKWKEKLLTSKRKTMKDMFDENMEAHILLNDFSLLFGGNEFRVCGKDPIHQPCHGDSAEGTVSLNKNPKLKNKIPNGSGIIPLFRQRAIYIKDPSEKIVPIVKGEILVFRGDLPHGGTTRRENDWDVAIHFHFDSVHHKRKQGLISMKEGLYLPLQHLKLVPTETFFKEYEETIKRFDYMTIEAYNRRGDLQAAASKKGGKGELTRGMCGRLLKRLKDMGATKAWVICKDIYEAGGAKEEEVEREAEKAAKASREESSSDEDNMEVDEQASVDELKAPNVPDKQVSPNVDDEQVSQNRDDEQVSPQEPSADTDKGSSTVTGHLAIATSPQGMGSEKVKGITKVKDGKVSVHTGVVGTRARARTRTGKQGGDSVLEKATAVVKQPSKTVSKAKALVKPPSKKTASNKKPSVPAASKKTTSKKSASATATVKKTKTKYVAARTTKNARKSAGGGEK